MRLTEDMISTIRWINAITFETNYDEKLALAIKDYIQKDMQPKTIRKYRLGQLKKECPSKLRDPKFLNIILNYIFDSRINDRVLALKALDRKNDKNWTALITEMSDKVINKIKDNTGVNNEN